MGIIEVINSLEDIISTGAASQEEIIQAEKELGITFATEYKEFLSKFGAILADGIELVGIAKSQSRNVVTMTKRERDYNEMIPSNLYVVENLGIEGIIIWQDENGLIYQSYPKSKPEKINESLAEYIKAR